METEKKEKRQKSGGRQVGTPNKIQAGLRERLAEMLISKEDAFFQNLQILTGKEYCDIYLKALSIIAPREIKADIEITEKKEFVAWIEEN